MQEDSGIKDTAEQDDRPWRRHYDLYQRTGWEAVVFLLGDLENGERLTLTGSHYNADDAGIDQVPSPDPPPSDRLREG